LLRTVKLYGHLGKTFQKEWKLDVKTPAEAIRAISANCKGFRSYLERYSEPGYRVLVGESELSRDTLSHPPGRGVIKIIPVVAGGGKGFFNIILGAALIIAAPYASGLASSAFLAGEIGLATLGTVAHLTAFAQTIGIAMALSGVAGLLAPSPSTATEERPENKPSYAFNGPINTVGQGNPVPILYGELIVGGQTISAGLSLDDISSECSVGAEKIACAIGGGFTK